MGKDNINETGDDCTNNDFGLISFLMLKSDESGLKSVFAHKYMSEDFAKVKARGCVKTKMSTLKNYRL